MFKSCTTCRRYAECRKICARVEALLPKLDERSRATLNLEDQSIAWFIQDHEAELPTQLRAVARLYYRDGWSQERIANRLGVRQNSISRFLAELRGVLGDLWIKTALYRGTDRVPEDEGGDE